MRLPKKNSRHKLKTKFCFWDFRNYWFLSFKIRTQCCTKIPWVLIDGVLGITVAIANEQDCRIQADQQINKLKGYKFQEQF